jgi:pyruvate,water dikinase
MQPGDILVSAITTPAWTPLFAMAPPSLPTWAGRSKPRQHRRPRVWHPGGVGTGAATRRFHSGQLITVDGTQERSFWPERCMGFFVNGLSRF